MIAITFSNVSKRFTLHAQRTRSFQEVLVNTVHRSAPERGQLFWALRGVGFEVARGETFALIGANGSGKSTALKLVARIIDPTSGEVFVRGRIAALLELGAGFHPDLTGRENIFLNGSILGLKRSFIRNQLDEIVAFSELERFIDVPIRNYSSGMLMRLGFSVATAFQPDILLIDEVLAVGDQAFQERCLRRIVDIQYQGATILLVTHDLSAVQKLCQRALWLDKGVAQADGPADEVTTRYLESVWKEAQAKQAATPAPAGPVTGSSATPAPVPGPREPASPAGPVRKGHTARWGSGEIRIEKVELLGVDGEPASVFRTGTRFAVRMWYHASQPLDRPAFGISLYDEQGSRLSGPNTIWSGAPIERVQGRGYVDCIVDELPLLPGRYELTVAIYDRYVAHPFDHWHHMASLVVIPGKGDRQDGTMYIPWHWEHREGVTS